MKLPTTTTCTINQLLSSLGGILMFACCFSLAIAFPPPPHPYGGGGEEPPSYSDEGGALGHNLGNHLPPPSSLHQQPYPLAEPIIHGKSHHLIGGLVFGEHPKLALHPPVPEPEIQPTIKLIHPGGGGGGGHGHGPPMVHVPIHHVPQPEPYHHHEPRFDPSHLAVHGYENHQRTIIPYPEPLIQHGPAIHHAPEPEPIAHIAKLGGGPHHYPGPIGPIAAAHGPAVALDLHENDPHHSFYHHGRKPGDGFGPGGHFEPMPQQEVKYVPVPEPFPVYKPFPVDKPYPVPVDKPFPVQVDKPYPEPYISKVIQPLIHKQAIIKSHIRHVTHEYPHPSAAVSHHPHHHANYHHHKSS